MELASTGVSRGSSHGWERRTLWRMILLRAGPKLLVRPGSFSGPSDELGSQQVSSGSSQSNEEQEIFTSNNCTRGRNAARTRGTCPFRLPPTHRDAEESCTTTEPLDPIPNKPPAAGTAFPLLPARQVQVRSVRGGRHRRCHTMRLGSDIWVVMRWTRGVDVAKVAGPDRCGPVEGQQG
jgi:hypothetical protein